MVGDGTRMGKFLRLSHRVYMFYANYSRYEDENEMRIIESRINGKIIKLSYDDLVEHFGLSNEGVEFIGDKCQESLGITDDELYNTIYIPGTPRKR